MQVKFKVQTHYYIIIKRMIIYNTADVIHCREVECAELTKTTGWTQIAPHSIVCY